MRQGFVGYVYVDGLQWRVMLRLRLEDEALWRGRLWFSEAGGTEVWDKEEILGRSPEELLRQARGLGAEGLVGRFRASYDERRRYFALRALLDDFLEKARTLSRIAVREAAGEMDRERARAELDRIQQEMQPLVVGLRQVAAKEGRLAG
jgi:DNA-binding Lrp family transcriptional regulator